MVLKVAALLLLLVHIAVGHAQISTVLDGKVALQFDSDSKMGPVSSFVERVERSGQSGFKFHIALIHSGGCTGFLSVFPSGAIFDGGESPGCKLSSSSIISAKVVPARFYSERIALRDIVYGFFFIYEDTKDKRTTLEAKRPYPLMNFFHLVVTDFRKAETQFQLVTAGAPLRRGDVSPSSSPGPAKLLVSSEPQDAQVYLQGELKGTAGESGITLELPPGIYQLRVAAPGYNDVTRSVTLAAGDNKEIITQLERAGPPPFAVADITELLKGGVSSKRVAALVQQRGVGFTLDDDSERTIRASGGDAELLLAIAKAKK